MSQRRRLVWRRHSLIVVVALAGALGCSNPSDTLVEPPPPEVTVAQPLEKEIVDHDEYTGRMRAVEDVEIRARVRGYITAVNFEEGTEVKAGDLLVEIDERPYRAILNSAKAELDVAKASLNEAEATLSRMEQALKNNAISEVQVIEERAKRDRPAATIEARKADVEQAELDLGFCKISAPVDGKIGRRLVTKGNLVNATGGVAGEKLATIVSVDPIFMYFTVDERAMLRYQRAARESRPPDAPQPRLRDMKRPVYLHLSGDEGYPHEGVLDFADNVVSPTTGTIEVRGVFSNERRIFTPGLYGRVRVPSGGPYQALLVPERAIGIDQGRKYLLIVDDNDVAQYRAITPGRLEDDGMRVIEEGLQPGERVIISGLQRARPGETVTPHPIDLAEELAAKRASPAAAARESASATTHPSS